MVKRKVDLSTFPMLESLLQRVESVAIGATSYEVVVPIRLTFHGRRIGHTFAQAVILDRLLNKGLVPVGSVEQDGNRLIKFGNEKPFDPSSLRTVPPPLDIVARVPALGPLAKMTTRLHPRRAAITDPAASKLGGTFLWPKSDPWPRCDDTRHQTGIDARGSATEGVCPLLVGAVQLNARDFPQVPFKPGTDLLQLLWCPTTEDVHDEACMFPKLFAYWRDSKSVTDPIAAHPLPDFTETIHNHFPVSCRFHPEVVHELPTPAGFYNHPKHDEIHSALVADETIWYQYQGELCACPGTKLGGHPYWIQNDDTPDCVCGERMEFLMQLWDWEYTNMDSTQRWIPPADRWAVKEWRTNPAAEAVLRPPHFDFGHEGYYIFVCAHCPDRPIRFIYQR